jgi:Ala-tRNA(Pro) deacylase
MPSKKLKEFLDKNNIKYVSIKHSLAFTAQEIAASAHIKGKNLAKTVLVKVDGKMIMVVLPASYKVNFDQLREAFGNENVRLANEQEFMDKFPECEVGAMPPFGNLYGLDVYVDESLAEDEEIAFNAGTHTELIQMAYADFERLVQPKKMKFSFLSKV